MLVPKGSKEDRLAGVLAELDETVFLADVEPGPTFRFSVLRGRPFRDHDGTPVNVEGCRVEDVLGEEGSARAYRWWSAALETGAPQRYRGHNVDLDGRERLVEVTVFPWAGGTQIAGVVRDITAEQEALERVRQRDAFSRAVLDAMGTATAVLGHDGRIRMVNAAWVVEATQRADDALPGDDLPGSLHQHPSVADGCREVLRGQRPYFATEFRDGDHWFHLRAVPFDVDGERGAVISRSDITARVAEQQALQRLHKRWEAAFASASIGMGLTDGTGRFVLVNPRLGTLLGREPEDLLGTSPLDFFHPDEQPLSQEQWADPGTGNRGIERRYTRADGTVLWAWVTWSTVMGDEPGDVHFFVQLQDVTPRKRAESRLQDHQELLELVAAGTPLRQVLGRIAEIGPSHLPGTHWILIAASPDGWEGSITAGGLSEERTAEVEEAFRSYAPSRWHDGPGVIVLPPDGGTPLAAALGLGGAWALPVVERGSHVTGFVVVHGAPPTVDPEAAALVEQMGSIVRIAVQRDAAAQRLAERLLEDTLTGLPSRTLFHTRTQQAMARLGSRTGGVAVLSADLDRFGRVNESLGHLAGDDVLAEMARRLCLAVPAPDTVARGGGDEFLILLEDVADADAAMAVAERVLAAIRQPVVMDGVEFTCQASVGVAFTGDPSRPTETLEGDAALAMAAAKSRGRDRALLYTEHLRETMPRLSLERDLQVALGREQFVVHFQPEVSIDDNRIVGAEALVRWQHPDLGLLPPADFVGTAEETGLIVDIGRLVLEESCARLAEWDQLGDEPLTVAVNLSARQLADPGLVDFIEETLHRHGIDPSQLVLEMTESTLVEDNERARAMFEALRRLGVRMAIDDFGTGYSSLLYLKRFPADLLKVDRSFVDGLGTVAGDSAIVAAVVRLAHELDLRVIAEGVETPEQLAHLRQLGCEQGQGYLWSRPIDADAMKALLQQPLPDIPEVPVAPLAAPDDRAELDELLAVLTHELSTPLTVIGGYAEMLADRLGDGDAGARTGVAAIERNVHNLGRLVAALADARGSAGGGETVRFDVVPLVEQTVGDLQHVLGDRAVSLERHVAAAVVAADPVGVRQVLTNLLANVAKFTETDTPLEVVLRQHAGVLGIEVIDHGPGIPPDRVDELFGRFARLGSTRRGLGLGLFLARTIARRHGGDLTYQATPGGGATFVFTLPVSTEDA